MFRRSSNFSYVALWLVFLMGMMTLSGRLIASRALTIVGINLCVLKMARDPQRAACSGGESWLHSRLQEPEFAIQSLELFLSSHPTHQIAQLRLGENKWKAGNEAEALAIWRQVPKMDVYFAHHSASCCQTRTNDRSRTARRHRTTH